VRIGHGSSGHLDVLATEEEEHDVAAETEDVEEDHQLGGTLGLKLKPLQDVAAHEDADAGAGDGNAAGEHAGHALGQIELGLQVLGQEDDEAGHDDELHAGPEAGHDVDLVGEELPHRLRDVLDVLAVVVLGVVLCRLPHERARPGGVLASRGAERRRQDAPVAAVRSRRCSVVRQGIGDLGPAGARADVGVGGVVVLLVDVNFHFFFLEF